VELLIVKELLFSACWLLKLNVTTNSPTEKPASSTLAFISLMLAALPFLK